MANPFSFAADELAILRRESQSESHPLTTRRHPDAKRKDLRLLLILALLKLPKWPPSNRSKQTRPRKCIDACWTHRMMVGSSETASVARQTNSFQRCKSRARGYSSDFSYGFLYCFLRLELTGGSLDRFPILFLCPSGSLAELCSYRLRFGGCKRCSAPTVITRLVSAYCHSDILGACIVTEASGEAWGRTRERASGNSIGGTWSHYLAGSGLDGRPLGNNEKYSGLRQ